MSKDSFHKNPEADATVGRPAGQAAGASPVTAGSEKARSGSRDARADQSQAGASTQSVPRPPPPPPGMADEGEVESGEASPVNPATPSGEESPLPEGPAPAPKLEQLLEAAKNEAAVNYDRFMRASAENENYKRRIQKEHADSLRYANTPLVRDLAATVDNLELAMAHARTEQQDSGTALLEGIEMVVKQIQEVFAKYGVTRLEAVGKPFDPELHEAMTVVETVDVPENQVMAEFQAGYKLYERVIRPARVSVSKRPAESAGEA